MSAHKTNEDAPSSPTDPQPPDAGQSPQRAAAAPQLAAPQLRPPSRARTLLGGFAALLLGLNCIFCVGVLLFPVAVVKLLVPRQGRLRALCDRILNRIARLWIDNNGRWQRATQDLRWDVAGLETLQPHGWYLVTCNHQSWVDIIVLQRVLNHRIPLLKFFLKQNLIYIPFMGFAWWALDFPFMQRHSKEYLEQHPEQRGKDLQTTRRACERFSQVPTSVLNFIEGTRRTPGKAQSQQSSYRHLLRPKAAGLALAVQTLGSKFSSLLSVTIVYPDGVPTFWEFLCNRLPRVTVRVQSVPIPPDLFEGDYETDTDYRQRFQSWVNAHWADKDVQIDALLTQIPGALPAASSLKLTS